MKTEHDFLAKCIYKNGNIITYENAVRAAKIARLRGMMKAYRDCGCQGSYDQIKQTLESLLKNKRYQP